LKAVRIIPCLLLKGRGLVKTIKFAKQRYVGDPINVVRIFNEKEVDELAVLDITASSEGRRPNFRLIEDIASEAFMPFSYGGGISSLDDARTLFRLGVDKVIVNSHAFADPGFIEELVRVAGGQSVVISIDVRKNLWGRYEVYTRNGQKKVSGEPASLALQMRDIGAGEILLTAIDRDGTMNGYDEALIRQVSCLLDIPVIASGGAGAISDFNLAVAAGASAAAAGSMFVFHGRQRAVLISYPARKEIEKAFAT